MWANMGISSTGRFERGFAARLVLMVEIRQASADHRIKQYVEHVGHLSTDIDRLIKKETS